MILKMITNPGTTYQHILNFHRRKRNGYPWDKGTYSSHKYSHSVSPLGISSVHQNIHQYLQTKKTVSNNVEGIRFAVVFDFAGQVRYKLYMLFIMFLVRNVLQMLHVS